MKHKLNLMGITFSILIAATIYQGCKKDNTTSSSNPTAKSSSDHILGNLLPKLSDLELISAIKGLNPQYKAPEDLIELLLDNAPLSEKVLTSIASENRLSNEFVEINFIISAPVSTSLITQLKTLRPDLDQTNIIQAQAKVSNDLKFAIINAPVRKIIFGNEITRQPWVGAACSSCSSEITATNALVISWGPEGGNIDGTAIFGWGKCNEKRWVCGKPENLTKIKVDRVHDVDVVTYGLNCVGEGKCFRR